MKYSLRLRTILASGLILVASLLVIVLSVMDSFEQAQLGLIRKELSAGTNVLITAASVENDRLVMPLTLPDEQFNHIESEVLGLVLDSKSQVVWRSRSSLDEVLDYSVEYEEETSHFFRYTGSKGSYFLYDIDIMLEGVPLTFLVMTPTTEYDELFSAFQHNLSTSLFMTAVIMLVLLWFGMRWPLIPIQKLADNLKGIEQGTSCTLTSAYTQELQPLTEALNQLLSNERQQQERYRQAMADLAHSLKTPLAVLQAVHQDPVLQRSTIPRDIQHTIDEQTDRMNQIISYQLQRAVIHHRGFVKQRANALEVTQRITKALSKVYGDKQIELQLNIDSETYFPTDQHDMMELLGNLLENAYRLCLQQVSVSTEVNTIDGKDWMMCRVEDDGAGVPEHQRKDILKRGVRADSRTSGQGLGLAIVMDILDIYGGTLSIDESSLGGALFELTLPA